MKTILGAWFRMLFIMLTFVNLFCKTSANKRGFPLEAYTWELEPYLYTDRASGQSVGMMKEYFEQYLKYVYCLNDTEQLLVDIKHIYGSRKEFEQAFHDIRRNHNTERHPEFRNSTMVSIWFPILDEKAYTVGGMLFEEGEGANELIIKQPLYGKTISIVAHRTEIDTVHKFIYLFVDLYKLLILVFATAVLFAILMWLFDQSYNTSEPPYFIIGCSRALWWSFITMTTVGYGDISPRRFLARISGSIWMVTGLIISSTVTAQVTQAYESSGVTLDDNKEIGVLRGSFEATFMTETLRKKIKVFETYDKLIEAFQNKNGNLSLIAMNSDVAAYKQNTWNDGVDQEQQIDVIQTYKVEVPIYYAMFGDVKSYDLYLNGCHDDPTEPEKVAVFKYRKEVQITTNHKMSLTSMLTEHNVVVTVMYVIITAIVIGVLLDVLMFLRKRYFLSKANSDTTIINNNFTELSTANNGWVKHQQQQQPQQNQATRDKASILKEIMKMSRADILNMAKEIAEIKKLTTDMVSTSNDPEEEC